MPAQVADWPQVKATAIATGSLLDAAEYHGIKYEAVRQRASREQWPVGHRVHKMLKQAQEQANTQIIRASNGSVTAVTSASEAAEIALKEGAKATRLGLTNYAKRMAQQASEQGTLEEAPLYKAVADIHGKMHPEQAQDTGMQFNFFQITQETVEESGPVIDLPE